MREKNGFIATSVLYAFLVAFLTLFLGFMANFIQNKQLINRIEDMAREELDSYGNVRISDLKIGDYVVLDTIDDEGDGTGTNSLYSSPINPDTKWILYKIDDTTEETTKKEGDTETIVTKNATDYYFVSDASAQKFTPIASANIPKNFVPGDGRVLTPTIAVPTLRTLSELLNYNIYYDAASKSYISFPSSITAKRNGAYYKYFTYEFLYNRNDGVDINFLNYTETQYILGLTNEKLKSAILDQGTHYTIWIEDEYAMAYGYDNGGFVSIGHKNFTQNDNVSNPTGISMMCETYSVYSHKYGGADWYDSCTYLDTLIGNCLNDNGVHCTSRIGSLNPRYTAVIRIYEPGDSTDGYIDSGNGTSALPYLITKGVKK